MMVVMMAFFVIVLIIILILVRIPVRVIMVAVAIPVELDVVDEQGRVFHYSAFRHLVYELELVLPAPLGSLLHRLVGPA